MTSITTWKADCLLDVKATLAEGPCWLEDRQALLWVDIEGSLVCLYNPATGKNQSWPFPCHVGVALPTKASDFLVATQNGFARLNPESGQIQWLMDPESDLPGNRFNDGKCDPQGRLWAGTIPYDRTPGAANLYCLDPQMNVRKMLTDVSVSNGLDWSHDGRTMYYVDSSTRRVDAFDFDGDTGTITNRRTIIRVPDEMGKPDGMTIDSEGMLWVALWGGWCVSRWDPASGELLGKVEVPVERTSSCCFGGPDYGQLFITTARSGADEHALAQQPLAGGLFVAETGFRGQPSHKFGA